MAPRSQHLTLVGATAVVVAAAAAGSAATTAATDAAGPDLRHPPLSVVRSALLTTAGEDFGNHEGALAASFEWHERTLGTLDRPAPYLACTAPGNNKKGLEALSFLRSVLAPGPGGARVISNSDEHGVCLLVTATPQEAETVKSFQIVAAEGGRGGGEGGGGGGGRGGRRRAGGRGGGGGGSPLSYWAPLPSTLKLAPGLLSYKGNRGSHDKIAGTKDDVEASRPAGGRSLDEEIGWQQIQQRRRHRRRRRLTTTHGKGLLDTAGHDDTGVDSKAHGLTVELTPGVLAATNTRRRRDAEADPIARVWYESSVQLADQWKDTLMSESLDVHGASFWSSSSVGLGEEGTHWWGSGAEGALLAREWTRAADVLHELGGVTGGPSVGQVCSWDEMTIHHIDDELLTLKGIDHLLPNGRGAGGTRGEESDELHVACFMGLLSFLTSRPEVMRVSAARKLRLLNAAAFPNIQSATSTETPLSDSGLDGAGEVIQIVDTGLDYNSCFFVDEDGKEVAHGHFFEEIGVEASSLGSWSPSFSKDPPIAQVFIGGDFNYNLGRRKIVQYIDLIRQDPVQSTSTLAYGTSWATSNGSRFAWLPAHDFGEDIPGGHGTHTAGSAAGATISSPATTEVCGNGREVSCVGGCIESNDADGEDDLLTAWEDVYLFAPHDAVDLDRLCPRYDCDGQAEAYCLDDHEGSTLAAHGGIARGAKLAIFDILDEYYGIGVQMAGNGIWEPAMEAGSKLHSNSWGNSQFCEYLPSDVLYDSFMYTNPENLLIFAAGNDGGGFDLGGCSLNSPAIAKNVLAVGASTSGRGRLSWTGVDGKATNGTNRVQNIDTVAYFSSFGPTLDGRIKPEVVAPGDLIYSAAGSGTDEYTCRLWNYPGTSMACPLVAGAGALIRQYFKDKRFYVFDVKARGFCDSFGCEAFSPSAATVKAMLINSANLMGGSAEPDGTRGFGRVHLEPGMPMAGNGKTVLFVADSAITNTTELALTEYSFEVSGNTGLELRATLCWIDPPATTFSAVQLVHDLDLAVYSPSGTRYSMWSSGEVDVVNNNERVIVPAEDVEGDPGNWVVRVWSKRLVGSDSQSYSLVVTGALEPPIESNGIIAEDVPVSSSSTIDDDTEGNTRSSSGGRRSVSLAGGNIIYYVVAIAVVVAAATFAAGVPLSVVCLAPLG